VLYRVIERVFVFVLLLSSMTVVDALTRPAYASGRDPDLTSTDVPLPTVIIESGVYASGVLLVLMRWRRVVNAARRVWPLVALTLLAAISVAWSDAPLLTVRRSAFLLGSTLIGIYLGERFSIEQLSRWLAQVLCTMMVASIILYCIAPSSVIDYAAYDGAWKGVAINKNAFGWYMALAVAVLLLVRFRRFRWLRYPFLLAAVVLLLLSRSATSLVGCVLIICIIPLWRLTRADVKTRRLVHVLMPVAICTGSFFVWVNQALVFSVLGRDSTLTGRTDLWALVLSAISKHPILGYGYGAFWSGMEDEALNIYIASKWLPMAAHNGYLELWLGVGILGVPLLLYLVLCSLRRAKDHIRSSESLLSLWPMSYLLLFLFHNFFESHLLETRSLEFLLFAAITTSLAMQRSGTEPRAAHARPYLFVNRKQPVYSPVAR
jgi:exopolysaccharide production protein ExoQ